jgi:hypothetical protein
MPTIVYDRKSGNPDNDHRDLGEYRRDDLTTWRGRDLPPVGSTILITEFASQGESGTETERTGAVVTDVAVFEQNHKAIGSLQERVSIERRVRTLWLHIWIQGRLSPIELDPTNPWEGWEPKTDQRDRDRTAHVVLATQVALRRQFTEIRKAGTPKALIDLLADLDQHLGMVAEQCQTVEL